MPNQAVVNRDFEELSIKSQFVRLACLGAVLPDYGDDYAPQ